MSLFCFTLANYSTYPSGMLVQCIDLEHGAPLVEIELDSGGLLLFLRAQVLCESGGQPNGALRDGGVCSRTPPRPGIPTDLQHRWDAEMETQA